MQLRKAGGRCPGTDSRMGGRAGAAGEPCSVRSPSSPTKIGRSAPPYCRFPKGRDGHPTGRLREEFSPSMSLGVKEPGRKSGIPSYSSCQAPARQGPARLLCFSCRRLVGRGPMLRLPTFVSGPVACPWFPLAKGIGWQTRIRENVSHVAEERGDEKG
jgi:hypothetical protein